MSEFLKPQSPLQHKDGAYVYPLTTVDQVILENNNRLNVLLENIIYANENEEEVARVPLDADTLNGYTAEDFIKPKAGFIYPLAGSVIPEGFLLCDGAEYKRTDFPELFVAIGTIYGSGDGSTTFNVPNLQTRVPVGSGSGYELGTTGGEATHTLTVDEMPSHTHSSQGYAMVNDSGDWSALISNGQATTQTVNVTGGSQPHNNMQPYTVVNYIIATGKDTGVSVSDIIMGAQAIPLEVQYGGTGATNVADVRKKFGIGVRNLLDNSDFTNPVNQRGLNSYSGLFANCIDRWLIYQISGQAEIHVEDGYIRLVPGRSLPSWTLQQQFPAGTFTASSYTLAYCDIDGNITIDNNPIHEGNDFNSNEAIQYITFSRYEEETKLVWAALYEGEYTLETLPEYQPKSYAEEIVACNLGETGNVTGTELLWENASPTSVFAKQTLSIPALDIYTRIYIEFAYNVNYASKSGVWSPFKDGDYAILFYDKYKRSLGRSGTNINIENESSSTNNYCVPLRIYGIKGVFA